MKYVIQFLIIAAFAFIGELLHWFIPLPIPASIYGIVLLFIALELKWVKISDIREVSSFLIAVMPIMFIPAAAGLMESWGAVKSSVWEYALITIVSTFVVMGVSGAVTQFVIWRGKKNEQVKKRSETETK
ncbi:MAG: CidA/LrgA family protein [Candidatus Cryptobacteroides sp.]|mgnify:FL=1|nr:CidA/LrgA family protein [Bacteroidales bacterium]MDY2774602.1 CidA/LrgA family protein [Candidatus Cryptobacteroides sp.]